jgi:hypothetical protein
LSQPEIQKDVTVHVPAGIWPPPKPAGELSKDDIIQMQATDLAKLRSDLKIQQFSAETIARFAICMIHIFKEWTGQDVARIPAELYNRMEGAEIQIAQPDDAGGDVFARYIEKYDGKVTLPVGVIR